MTITPQWGRQKARITPAGMPSIDQAQNLSDLDVTQQSASLARASNSSTSPELPKSATPGAEIKPPTVRVDHHNSSADDALIGTVFSERYEVLELLGRGGMGSVYKARNRINKNFRALKLMHAHLIADPQVFRRFQQEATAAARINHPNAITIIDMGMATDGRPYLIMDFLDGISLSELLKYKTKLPIREALHLFAQMCGALAEAHSHGVIHRDIKPSNVMLVDGKMSGDYIVKVVDFGIAKVFPQEGDPTMKDTTTGELFGSPPYMSPEQCLGKRLDYRSDIYSMGCLMYEVLTGAPPLVGQNALGTMYRQINEMPTPLTDIRDDVRLIQRLDEIITRSLQKDPDNRYQTIVDLQHDLETAGEISAQKSHVLSAIRLKLQVLERNVLNRLGSSKRAVCMSLIISLTALSVFSVSAAPYLLNKDPGGAERLIFWQAPRQTPSTSNLRYALESRLNDVKLLYGAVSQPTLEARSELANLIFLNDKTDKALFQFESACAIGEELLKDKFVKCANPILVINIFAKDQLRRVQCLNSLPTQRLYKLPSLTMDELKFPSKPESLANATIALLKPEGSEEAFAYLQAALGVNAQRGQNAGNTNLKDSIDKSFENVLSSWQKVHLSKENSEVFAPILSQIADYYLGLNETAALPKAKLAYELSKLSWKQLGNKGLNNFAVAEDRLGQVQKRMGNYKTAVNFFKEAVADFSIVNKTDTLDKARALFDEADARWAAKDYLGALQTHDNACRIWSARRSNN